MALADFATVQQDNTRWFLSNLHMMHNELRGVVLENIPQANVPNPPAGATIYDSNLNQLCYYNGTNWVCLDAATLDTDEVLLNAGPPAGAATEKIGVDQTTGDIYYQDTGGNWAALATTFGNEFQLFTNAGVDTNDTGNFQNKLSVTTTALVGGTYAIKVGFGWNLDATNRDFEADFQVDGASVSARGLILKQEPKGAAGNFGATGTSQAFAFERTYHRVLAGGTHILQLMWRSDQNNVEASIWDAEVAIWRVA